MDGRDVFRDRRHLLELLHLELDRRARLRLITAVPANVLALWRRYWTAVVASLTDVVGRIGYSQRLS